MPREKPAYRDQLEELRHTFNAELITVRQAAIHLGCDTRTLLRDREFPVKQIGGRRYVSIVNLARWLS